MQSTGKDARGSQTVTKKAQAMGRSMVCAFLVCFKSINSVLRRAKGSFAISLVLILLSMLLLGLNANNNLAQATSTTLNFQGRLLTNTGGLVADGTYNVEFNLYNVASGGTTLWTEDRLVTNTQGVTVRNGYFSVYLGEYDSLAGVNWNQNLWLGMTVRGTGNCAWGSCTPTDSEMTPRFALSAVPYAYQSAKVASANTTTASTNSNNVSITTGNATGATSNSGNINIDVGTATQTTGTISLGASNASAILFGNSTTNPNFTFQGSGTFTIASLDCTSFTNGGALTANGSGVISCSNDDGGAGGGGDSITVNATAATDLNFLNVTADATTAGTAWTLNTGSNPDDLTLTISTASASAAGITTANAQTFGGTKTFANNIELGAASTTTGAITFYNSANANLTILQAGNASTTPLTFTLPTAYAAANGECLKSTTGGAFSFGNCTGGSGSGGAITLQDAYTASTNPEIVVDGTRGALTVRDNSTPIGANLLEVQNNAGTATFFSVDTGGITVDGTIAVLGDTTANRPAGAEGELYFDTDTNNLLQYTGSRWQAFRGEYTIVAANDSSQTEKDSADYVADGTSDEDEINSALTAAAGGKVLLLAGTYVADGTILIPNNTTLAGVGPGSVVRLDVGSGTDDLIENSDTTTGTGVVLKDLSLDGSLGSGGTQNGIDLYGIGDVAASRIGAIIDNITVRNFRSSGIRAADFDNTIIRNTKLLDNVQSGITTTAPLSYKNIISNNQLNGNGTGINVDSLFESNIESNVIVGGTIGMVANGASLSINGNNIQNSTTYGIQLYNGLEGVVSNNVIYNTGGATSNNGIYTDNADNYNISGNYITDSECTTSCYAINIAGAGAVKNYLEGNRYSGSAANAASINDVGTNTIYVNQQTNSTTSTNSDVSDFRFRGSTNSTTAFAVQNASGSSVLNVNTTTAGVGVTGTLSVSGTTTLSSLTTAGIVTNTAAGVLGTTNNLAVNLGGTGLTSYTTGDLLYASGATTLSKLAAVASGSCLISNGVGVAPSWGACGSATTLQGAYNAGSAGDQVISLSSTNDSIIFRNPSSSGTDSGFVALFDQLNTGAVEGVRINTAGTGNLLTLQNSGTAVLGITSNGNLVGNNSTSGGTTGTTTGTGTNTTTLTLTADAFNVNDVVYIDNAGTDYVTRITVDPGTGSYTVSPAVTFETGRTVTRYTRFQNLGATATDYSTLSNRFFEGYFLGGVKVGTGTTTLSDGRLSTTDGFNINTSSTTGVALTVNNSTSTGNIVNFQDNGTTVASIADGGAVNFKNTTNSTSAFSIQNATNAYLLNADTTNRSVTIGTNQVTGAKLLVKGEPADTNAVWTARTAASASSWQDVTYGNGQYVAVMYAASGSTVMTSPDAISWTSRSIPSNSQYGVAYGNGMFVTVGFPSGASSPDGITWTARTIAGANNGVTYGNGLFVAVANFDIVSTSPDGINWTQRKSYNASGYHWQDVTYGNNLFVAVNQSNAQRVQTSPDGINWTYQTSPTLAWNSVTYGNSTYVAVGNSGAVMTSSDGINWTSRTAAEANNWREVTFGNGLFVAVSNNGTNRVMTSADGITWTAQAAAEANAWQGVTYGGGMYVAVSSDGTNRVMTRPDGTGTPIALRVDGLTALDGATSVKADATSLFSVQNAGGTSLLNVNSITNQIAITGNSVLTGASTGAALTVSNSTSTGNILTLNDNATTVASIADGGAVNFKNTTNSTSAFSIQNATNAYLLNVDTTNRSVTIGTNQVTGAKLLVKGEPADTNAVWTQRTATADTWSGELAYGNGTFVALSNDADTLTSSDGVGWTHNSNTITNGGGWATIDYVNGLFIAGGYGSAGTSRISTSTNGVNWSDKTAPAGGNWTAFAYGNNTYVAVGDVSGNRVATSPDTNTWTVRTPAESNAWKSVVYGAGLFVAVSSDGTNRVMTSPDGITWTSQTAPSNAWQSVTYGNSLFVAVGTNAVMTSPDGINWTARTPAENNSWAAVTYGSGGYVAVGTSGTNRSMYSTDGINWNAQAAAAALSWTDVVYSPEHGMYVASATNGTANNIMTRPDGTGIPVALRVDGPTALNGATTIKASAASLLSLQSASGANILNANSITNQITIGQSDTTGTLLVLDTKTDSGDPTGTNGAMYYSANTNTFRCYENGAWKNCSESSNAFAQNGNSFGATAVLGTNDNYGLNFEVNNTAVATISNTGQTTFQNITNSTSAFRIQNAAGTNTVLNVDTTYNRIGVNTTSAEGTLHVVQSSGNASKIIVDYDGIAANGSTAFSVLEFGSRSTAGSASWTSSLTSAESQVGFGAYDSVDNVIYLPTVGSALIYRCDIDVSDCDATGDWSTVYDHATESGIYSMTIDTTNRILYAGTYSNANILRCDIAATNCDQAGDWTTAYATGEEIIRQMIFDDSAGVIYAASGATAKIFRCDISTTGSCDDSGDWTTMDISAGNYANAIIEDTANNVLYVGVGSVNDILRCDIDATNCDQAGDWTTSNANTTNAVNALEYDSANGVIYAGKNTTGEILRCDTSSSCDADGDWTLAYDTPQANIWGIKFASDTGKLYAGGTADGILYECSVATGCDSASDWSTSYDSANSSNIPRLVIPSQNLVYTSTGSTLDLLRLDTSAVNGSVKDFITINAYATDTTNASEDGAIGITTLVNGTAVQGFYLQGGSATLGTSTVAGTLVLNDGNGGQTATIQLGNVSANTVLTLPATLGATDTFCFQTLNNCSGLSASLADNTADAWDIQEGTNNYFNINTTDGNEAITLGNTTTNPRIILSGGGGLLASNTATATTGTTTGTGTNTTTLTLTADAFNVNDVVLIDNAGQDYYTRITVDPGTGSYTVSPAVTFETGRTVTKYNIQNIGATATDYSTLSNRFFEGYFLGSVNVGTGTTTLSDGNLSSSNNLTLSSQGSTTLSGGATSNILNVDASNLSTGNALKVTGSSASQTSGSLANITQNGTYTSGLPVSGNVLNVNRDVTVNDSSSPAVVKGTTTPYYCNCTDRSSHTFSHTVTAQTNQILIVGVGTYSGSDPVSVTYGGVSLTKYTSAGSGIASSASIWYLVNPSVGTATVEITTSGNNRVGAHATNFHNVDQTSPLSGAQTNSANGTSTSLDVSSSTGDMVIDQIIVTLSVDSINIGAGQSTIMLWNGGSAIDVAASYEAGTTTNTMSHSWTGADNFGHVALNINAHTGSGIGLSGAALNVSSNCTKTAGECYDSSNVLAVTQSYTGSTGSVARIQGYGTGNLLELVDSTTTVLTVADGGAITQQATSTTAFRIQSAAGVETVFNVNTGTRSSGVSGNQLKVGNSTGTDTDLTLFVLDSATADPTTNGGAVLNGSMYYDSTSNSFRCYQNSTWYDCLSGGNTESVSLIPEFTGAIFQGDGTNNTGTMNSGFCSGTSRLSINTSICGATEEYNYYEWTTSTGDNDYDIYLRYKMPSDFNGFTSDTTISMSGWRTDATNNQVQLAMFQANGTQCGSTTNVATGTGAWSTVSMTGNETGCTVAANDTVLFRIRLTATGTEYARAGAITFSYYKAF